MLVNIRVIPIIDYVPSFLLTKPSLAETILSTLAGAWLSVTTFTFSTTMVVLTTYSSNDSPRVVENFLQNKTTMRVLGTFTGGFIYCVTMLLLINESFASDLLLSPIVAILYAFWCIIQFVKFIFSVSNAIQPQNLIESLYQETTAQITSYVEDNKFLRSAHLDVEDFGQSMTIESVESGQLATIDSAKILELLDDQTFQLVIHPQIGDFIWEGQTLATLYSDAPLSLEQDQLDNIIKQFYLSNKRYARLDYRYAIQKIVDVAVRALSPGINDPNTAIRAIRALGRITGQLSQIEGIYDVVQLEKETGPVSEIIMENHNLKKDLFLMYSQIIEYGKSDIQVVVDLLAAIEGAMYISLPSNRPYLYDMGCYIYDLAIQAHHHETKIKIIENAIKKLEQVTNSDRKIDTM